MSELKICSQCNKAKEAAIGFYQSGGRYRTECKACTIKRNIRYQRRTEAWKHRYGNDEERREYMRAYYNNNKDKFSKYRSKFRERFPDYYTNYFRKKKEK